MQSLTADVDELETRLRRLIGLIHEPTMTLDRLRLMVPLPPGTTNGTGPRT
jgi:hypothetical protein